MKKKNTDLELFKIATDNATKGMKPIIKSYKNHIGDAIINCTECGRKLYGDELECPACKVELDWSELDELEGY